MKLIIDIPEVDYNYAKQQVADGITNPLKIFIASGIPLEQIRAEIEKQAWEIAISDTDRANGMWDAYRIIDHYTK